MNSFHVIAVLVSLAAVFSYVNHRYIHLHATVGVMIISLLMSLGLIALGHWEPGVRRATEGFLGRVQFGDALLQWMLGFLLFAGALTVDVNELSQHRGLTIALATIGTIVNMLLAGGLAWLLLHMMGLGLSLVNSLLLGAVLAPTDPVAVLGTIRRAGAPKSIQNVIAAESLFNDGVGVVMFLSLLALSRNDGSVNWGSVLLLLGRQSLGGAALGFVTGWCVYQLLNRVHNYQLEILLTLALVMGSYSLADVLQLSGPIAVVVAGLLICNHGRVFNLAPDVSEDLSRFWELIDEILNAVLFLLIGLQIMVAPYAAPSLLAATLMIPVALLSRWLSVTGIAGLFSFRRQFPRGMVRILTWGGLRGGLAVAMALSLPHGVARDRIVAITYVVVIFSIVIQGTTTAAFVRRFAGIRRDTSPISDEL